MEKRDTTSNWIRACNVSIYLQRCIFPLNKMIIPTELMIVRTRKLSLAWNFLFRFGFQLPAFVLIFAISTNLHWFKPYRSYNTLHDSLWHVSVYDLMSWTLMQINRAYLSLSLWTAFLSVIIQFCAFNESILLIFFVRVTCCSGMNINIRLRPLSNDTHTHTHTRQRKKNHAISIVHALGYYAQYIPTQMKQVEMAESLFFWLSEIRAIHCSYISTPIRRSLRQFVETDVFIEIERAQNWYQTRNLTHFSRIKSIFLNLGKFTVFKEMRQKPFW